MTTGIPTGYTDSPLMVDAPSEVNTNPTADIGPYGTAPAVPAGTDIARAHATLSKVADQFGDYVGNIDSDKYTLDGLRGEINRFADTEAARSIDAAVNLATQRRDQAQADFDTALTDLHPELDTADELRATRYWNRVQRRLDVIEPGKLSIEAEQLLRQAVPKQLGVLVEELVPYMQSRGVTFDASFKAMLKSVAPSYAQASEQLDSAEKARQIIASGATQLRQRMAIPHPRNWRRPVTLDTGLVDPRKYDPDR
jgi:hypothetical protein